MYTNKSFLTRKSEGTVIDIADCPADTVSDIAFNGDGSVAAVASWDGTVSLYRVAGAYANTAFQSTPTPKREMSHVLGKPVLCVAFFGASLVAGLVDGTLAVVAPNGQTNAFAAHSAAIKRCINYNDQYLLTGSFDGTIKFWDLKSCQPLHTVALAGKVYAMDLAGAMLTVALSNKAIYIIDMNNVQAPATISTRLVFPLRSISASPDCDTIAVGGVEAKIEVLSRSYEQKRFVIRSHREASKLYAVNVVCFHRSDPNVVVSGGADGNLIWFDKINRTKLATMAYNAPITAGVFSPDSRFFLFASGDDWSKGYTGAFVKPQLRLVDVKTVQGLNK